MAELKLRVVAEYQSAIQCRKELDEVVKKMKQLNENSSPQEIEHYMKRYAELTAAYEKSMSFIGKAGAYIGETWKGISRTIQYSVDATEDLGTAQKSIIETAQKRLQTEEKIRDAIKKEKEEAERQGNIIASKKNSKIDDYDNLRTDLEKKYNGAGRGYYSEDDQKALTDLENELKALTKQWDENNTKIMVYDQLMEESQRRTALLGQAIGEASDVYKGFADTVDSTSTKIFLSEEVFNRYHELSRTIENLKQEITDLGSQDDIDIPTLKGKQKELQDAQEEFRALDEAARSMAETLGARLSSRISQALTNLYSLNDSVRKTGDVVSLLEQQLKEAKRELAEAKDPAAITKASEAVDALTVKLDGARDQLSKFKAEQKDAVKEIENLRKYLDNGGGPNGPDGPDITNAVTEQMRGMVGNIAAIAGIGFGLNELTEFFSKAKEWREYFQDIESSMKVFLGSAEKGAEFTAKLKDYAYYNMFEFSDLAAASQQMISYGHNVENIIPRLDQLSNVATGTHGSLMELVDTYNRAKATGVVDARGIQSWAVNGVMIKDVLRDMGEVTAGTTITFEQLNKVLDKITGEGGQFHNLMLEMMDNISAESGQLEDNLAAMYEEIGEKFEGVFVKWLKLQSAIAENHGSIVSDELLDWGAEKANAILDDLLENWQRYLDMIKNVVVAYGIYRAALIANSAWEKAAVKWKSLDNTLTKLNTAITEKQAASKLAEAAAEGTNAAATSANTGATNANTAAKVANWKITKLLTIGMKQLQLAMLSHPYAIAVAGLAAVAYACYSAYDGILTQVKAQHMLNDASETFNDKMEEQAQKDRTNISIIQDKTASLVAQTKAYKQLIAEREIFAQFTKDEIANMSSEQIGSLISEDTARKDEDRIRNQVEAAKELQQIFAGKNAAWLYGEDADIDAVIEKYKLLPEYAEELKNSIGGFTDLSDWAAQLVESSNHKLQEYLVKEAESGIIEGFRKGMSSPDVEADVSKLMSDYSAAIEAKNAETEKKIEEARARIERLRNGTEKTSSSTERNSLINGLNKQIESLQSKLVEARGDISKTFGDTFREQVSKANEKVKELDHNAARATGQKKITLEAELKKAKDDRDVMENVLKLIEAGRIDTEIVINVKRQVENAEIGDKALVDIGEDYKKIDDVAQDVLDRMEDVKRKYGEVKDKSHVDLQQMMDDAGLTADGINSDFENATKNIQGEIDKLQKKLDDTKTDKGEKHKIQLEIARKQEQIDYINNLKKQLTSLCKDPFNIIVDIRAKADSMMKSVMKFIGMDVSERGQKEGEEAQANLDANKDNGPEKKTGKEWEQARTKALREELKAVNEELKKPIDEKTYEQLKQRKDKLEAELKKGAKGAKEALQRMQKDYDLFLKTREQQIEQEKKAVNAGEEARIAAIENATAREREARKNQFRLTEQSIKDQETAFKKANVDLERQKWQNDPKNKTRVWAETATAQDIKKNGYDNIALTESQQQQIKAMRDKARAEESRYYREQREAQAQSLRDYLKEYGDYQEKKLAIAEDYAEKIRKAEEAGDTAGAMKLSRESVNKQEEVDRQESARRMQEIKDSMDWEGLFNNLDRYSVDFLQNTLQNLQALMKDESLQPTDRQTIADKIAAVTDMINQKSESTFRWVNDYLAEQKRLHEEAKRATDEYNEALDAEIKAKGEEYSKRLDLQDVVNALTPENLKAQGVEIDVTDLDTKDTKRVEEIFKMLGYSMDDTSEGAEKLRAALVALTGAEENTEKATEKTNKKKGEKDNAKNKEEIPLKDRVAGFFKGLNDDAQKYLGDLPGLFDQLGMGGIADGISKGLGAMDDAAGAAEAFAKQDYIGAATKAISAITNVMGIFGGGSNAAEMLEIQADARDRLAVISEKVGLISDKLDKSYGMEAVKTQEELVDYINSAQEQIYRGLMAAGQSDYGGKHSEWYHRNKNGGESGYGYDPATGQMGYQKGYVERLKEAYNLNFSGTSWQDFFDYINSLEDNEGARILHDLRERSDLQDIWYELMRTTSYDEGALADWVTQWADSWDQIHDAEETLWERILATTYDDVFGDFMSHMYDLGRGAKDVFSGMADDWQEMQNRMMIDNVIGTETQENLKKWYENWAKAIQDINKKKEQGLYASEKEYRDALKNANEEAKTAYNAIRDEEAAEIKSLREMGAIKDVDNQQQSATSKSISNISYDQADAIEGILLGHTILHEQSHNELTLLNATTAQIVPIMGEQRDIAADSRDILAGMAIHVEEIRDGVVDTIVPRIKNIDDEIVRVRKAVEEQ